MITNKGLYNLDYDEIKRRIAIKSIKAISYASLEDNREFVIHVRKEYDYWYDSEHRREIVNALKFIWWMEHKVNLTIYKVPESLQYYHTSKEDTE